jgi:hypothetical protein
MQLHLRTHARDQMSGSRSSPSSYAVFFLLAFFRWWQVRRMKATHDYVGKDDNELTFKEGDTIMVPAPELEGSKSMIKGACARAALRLILSVLLVVGT